MSIGYCVEIRARYSYHSGADPYTDGIRVRARVRARVRVRVRKIATRGQIR